MKSSEGISIPNFPPIFRLTEDQEDVAIMLAIQNLTGPLAVSFYASMQEAISESAWGKSDLWETEGGYCKFPIFRIFRVLGESVISGKYRRRELSFYLPLPIQALHLMRRKMGFEELLPCTPPGYNDAFTFRPADDAKSHNDDQVTSARILAKNFTILDQPLLALKLHWALCELDESKSWRSPSPVSGE